MYHSGGGGVDRRGRRRRVLADGDGDGAGGAAAAEAARYRARASRLERVERLHRARQRLQQLRDAVRLGGQPDQTEERLLQLLRAMFLCSHAHAAVVRVWPVVVDESHVIRRWGALYLRLSASCRFACFDSITLIMNLLCIILFCVVNCHNAHATHHCAKH